MGLLDIFKKKTLTEKMEGYAEKGYIGKLKDATEEHKPKELRLEALAALRLIKHRESVDCLMASLRDEDLDIRKAATKSLLMNGTKDKTDHLLNYAESEEDEDLAELLKQAAISSRDRTPRV